MLIQSRESRKWELIPGKDLLSFCCSLGLFLIVFSVLRGPLLIWDEAFLHIFPSGTYSALMGVLLILFGIALNGRVSSSLFVSPLAHASGLICYLISDAPNRNYSLFQGPSIRGEILLVSLLLPIILKFRIKKILTTYLLAAIAVVVLSFIRESEGRVIFNDDHPAVFYRLSLLKSMFPEFPFYNPQWNAGIEARDFLSTGIINFFLIYYPIIKLFDLERTYNYMVIFTNTVGLPLSAYFGSRLIGVRRESSVISALIVLGTSLSWYQWLLKYGTMGFVTSAIISLFVFCFFCRSYIDKRFKPGWIQVVIAALLTCLMLMWTPIWFIFLPVAMFILSDIRRLLRKRWFCLLSAVVIIITVPWLIVWLKVSNVLSFVTAPSADEKKVSIASSEGVTADTPGLASNNMEGRKDSRKYGGKARQLQLKGVFKELRRVAVGVNPLIVVLAAPAILSLPRRRLRWLFGITTSWLLVLGSALSFIKPQLELERLLVVMALLLCIPIGSYISKLLARYQHKRGGSLSRFASIPIFSCLLLTPVTTAGVVRNRTLEHFAFKPSAFQEMTGLINSYGGDGRVLFSGFVLHELGGGHLAPLALEVSNPLIAVSQVHDHWSYHNSIPDYYLRLKDDGVEQYFDYLNVSSVLAHERVWKKYFHMRPELYTYRGKAGMFELFARKNPTHSYFLQGEGSLDAQNFNSVLVTPKSSELIIKFRYINKLISSGCKISSFDLPGELKLIRLTDCEPGKQVRISRQRELW
jgi:hypothetical protein